MVLTYKASWFEPPKSVSIRPFIFLVLACHQSVLDRFYQHFQATVHFPLSSDIDNFMGMLGIKPGAAGSRSKHTNHSPLLLPIRHLLYGTWFVLSCFPQALFKSWNKTESNLVESSSSLSRSRLSHSLCLAATAFKDVWICWTSYFSWSTRILEWCLFDGGSLFTKMSRRSQLLKNRKLSKWK